MAFAYLARACVTQRTHANFLGPFLESPEKPFVKLRLAYSERLVFSYVVKGIKIEISFVPRDAFVLKIQRELCHSKCVRKVSGLSRNGLQEPLDLEKHGLVCYYVHRGPPAVTTSIATKTLQIKHLIGRMNKNNRAARAVK